jgi:hypothetical protein
LRRGHRLGPNSSPPSTANFFLCRLRSWLTRLRSPKTLSVDVEIANQDLSCLASGAKGEQRVADQEAHITRLGALGHDVALAEARLLILHSQLARARRHFYGGGVG